MELDPYCNTGKCALAEVCIVRMILVKYVSMHLHSHLNW